MAISKMMFCNITGNNSALDEVLLWCYRFSAFHPESAYSNTAGYHRSDDNPYEVLLNKIIKTAADASIPLRDKDKSGGLEQPVDIDDFEELIARILEKSGELSQFLKAKKNIDIAPENIFKNSYMKFRFGRLSAPQHKKLLKDHHMSGQFKLYELKSSRLWVWCIYFVDADSSHEVDDYFEKLKFQQFYLDRSVFADPKELSEFFSDSGSLPLEKLSEYAEDFDSRILELSGKRLRYAEEIKRFEDALVHLRHLESMDISFDELFACKYLNIKFGRLPVDSFLKLKYYNDRMFIFYPFDCDDNYYWGIYVTLEKFQTENNAIFSSLYFEEISIPEFVHGTPHLAREKLTLELESARKELKKTELDLRQFVDSRSLYFHEIYSKVKTMRDAYSLRRLVTQSEEKFTIIGFVEKSQAEGFKKELEALDSVAVALMPHDTNPRYQPPTKLQNPPLIKPFEMFTNMYGLPAYSDLDPTPFLAAVYTLLFGVMFGDLGQGVCISLIGFFMWKLKRMQLGQIMVRIGISSAFFGLVYGSVFGFEHMLDPMYRVIGFSEKPLHVADPRITMTVFGATIALGVALIISAMLFNVVVGLRKKDYERAIFGHNGLAGLALYAAVAFCAASLLLNGTNYFSPPVIALLIVLLLIVFLKEPLGQLAKKHYHSIKPHDGIGSFVLVGFFELFEVMLSFFSNTLSFMRVGGFILSHAGMMSVVFLLAGLVNQSSPSPFVLVVGNIIVMCLEGLIVGIQVLRLNFYEMFSRFNEGGGVEFVSTADRVNT